MTGAPPDPATPPEPSPPAQASSSPTAVTAGERDRERSEAVASGLLGIVMVIGAVVVLVDAAGLRQSDAALGPAAAPTLAGILLGVLGATLVVRSARFVRTPAAAPETRRLWRLAAMVVALIAFALLLPIMGYVVSSAALFTAAALLLGAPHPGRVVAYGWTVAAVAFLIFDRVIGLTLPAGPWGF